MYKEIFNCKYGRVVYGTDCKRCNNNKQCFSKREGVRIKESETKVWN